MFPSPKYSRNLLVLLLTGSFLICPSISTVHAQTEPPPPAAQKKPSATSTAPPGPNQDDYSQEAVVIEQLKTSYYFEPNGAGRREQLVRVKVQSEAGLERFGQLVFPYSSANENLTVDYVRVRKPDGTHVTASASDIQDLTAPVAREAPVYTDLREKHVTVRGFRPGDSLEYHIIWTIQPVAQNHFWLEHNFVTRGVIVLRDELEVNLPASSKAKLKLEQGFDPSIKEQNSRRVYFWQRANLKSEEPETDEKTDELEQPSEPKPHVQLTTFQNWDEVGQWYSGLQKDRIVPDSRVKAKAEEIVRGRLNDREKIQALYEYVAKSFRYVSLSFGQARYQPHGAAEVLTNEYGDCKDKHTLLAAMLNATGLQAYPVLIHSSRKIDPEVPSPAQFNHVISAIPVGTETFWVDTTAEVAPFRLLASPLRNKEALLIPTTSAARLETTPAQPPFRSIETVALDGQVDELGRLTAHAKLIFRGDSEMYLRMMFRRTPKSNWKDLGYFLGGVSGMIGKVTDIRVSDPSDLEKPFEVEYDVTRENFLNWSSKRLKVELPLPSVRLRQHYPGRNETKPIELGAPVDINYRLKITLPARYQARVPVPLSVMRDYAAYQSAYKFEANTLTVERSLRVDKYELPADRSQDYVAFVAASRSDEAQTLSLESDIAGAPTIPDTVKLEELMAAAQTAVESENFLLAEQLLKRAVEKDTKHKSVRRNLAYVLSRQLKFDETIGVLKEQVKINSYDDFAYGLMGRVYWRQQQYGLAEDAFRKQLEISPLDKAVQGNLAQMLVQWRKFKEAIPELQKAISLDPEAEMLLVSLGRAYLGLGETKKGIAAFDQAIKLRPGQLVWNDVAYYLAVGNVELEKAQQYSESAVTAVSTNLRNVDLQNLTLADLNAVSSLAANWDTLGWVHFQKGDVDLAEKYIRAAWALDQHSEVGYHLGQIAEKRGNTELAMGLYAQAAIAKRLVPEATESFTRLVAKEKQESLTSKAKDELLKARTFQLEGAPTDPNATSQAQFYLSLVPDASGRAQVTQVKFIDGSEKLKTLESQLKHLRYDFVFPGSSPTKIILRGTVVCAPKSTACSLVMMTPDSIVSLQ